MALGQERHLPHEAWHVVQQAQGRVKPTFQMKGMAVNDDEGLEHEADIMGERAVQSVGTHPEAILQRRLQEAGYLTQKTRSPPIQLLSEDNIKRVMQKDPQMNNIFSPNFLQDHLIINAPFNADSALNTHLVRWQTYQTLENTVIDMNLNDAIIELTGLLFEIDQIPSLGQTFLFNTIETYHAITTKFPRHGADRRWLLENAGSGNWIEIDDLLYPPGRAIYITQDNIRKIKLKAQYHGSRGMQIYHYEPPDD